jgi:hypothetical protein
MPTEYRHSVVATTALALKIAVWCLMGLSAIVLLLFLFNVAPLVMLPFSKPGAEGSRRPTSGPGTIERGFSASQIRRRVAAIRELTASPEAVADAAKSLTIVGLQFNRLRDGRLNATRDATAHDPLDAPYPVKLDLSQTHGNALVALSDQAIEWAIAPPPTDAPRAIFGIESHVLPEFSDVPQGVLAGFRTTDTNSRSIATPLQARAGARGELRKFCQSVADWTAFFSLPVSDVNYVLVEDPTELIFHSGEWTSSGRVLLKLDNRALRSTCEQVDRESW